MSIILLIRHGNISLPDCVPGRMPDVHLSPDGQRQAMHIVERLSSLPINAVFSSPLDRAIETAEPICSSRMLRMQLDDHFNEIDFGEWTGQRFDELEKNEQWKQFHSFRNGCQIPGGELMASVQARMIDGILNVNNRYPEGTFAIVSHNDPIKSVLAYFLGVSLDLFQRIEIATGSISVLELLGTSSVVRSINITDDAVLHTL